MRKVPLIDYPDDDDLTYQLKQEATALCRLCYIWRKDSRSISCGLDEDWGPSEPEMQAAGALEYTKQTDIIPSENDHINDDVSGEEMEYYEEELYEQLETMALRDEYRAKSFQSPQFLTEDASSDSERSASPSPTKKCHRQGR